MAAARRARKVHSADLRVGSKVSFVLGGRRVRGTIVEDRGYIGLQGRRLFTVRIKRMWAEDVLLEIAADELRAA
jgi:hypothetical protein